MSLALITLGLLAPPPAHAQFMGMFGSFAPLVPCDASGNALPNYSPDNQGFYGLDQTQQQTTAPTVSGNYALIPQNSSGAVDFGSAAHGWYGYITANNTTLPAWCQMFGFWMPGAWMPNAPILSYLSNGSWSAVPVSGEIQETTTASLLGYFKLTAASGYGPGTYPATLTLLVRTTLYPNTSMACYTSALPPGLSATVTASFPFLNTKITPPTSNWIGFSSAPIWTGYTLKQCPVDQNGVVTVDMGSGTMTADLVNTVDYSAYGPAQANASPGITAAAKLPTVGALSASYINKDLPFNTTYTPISNGGLVYGGSVRFTSDELLLNAADPKPVPGTTYTWSTFGAGTSAPPSGGSTWNVIVPPTPGLATFDCLVQVPGAPLPTLKQLNVEIGVRTDDTIMVGWIDPTGVTVPSGAAALAAGVDQEVLDKFAPGTGSYPPGSDPNFPFTPTAAAAAIVSLAGNDDCMDYALPWPSHVYSLADKDFILNWMFKYAPNLDPTPTLQNLQTTDWTNPNVPLPTWDNPNPVPVNTSSNFTCYDGYMDDTKYQAYRANGQNYKLLNRFQVKYRVSLTNPTQFNGTPTVLHQDAIVGATVNPTNIPPSFIENTLNLLAELPAPFNWGFIPAANTANGLLDPQYGPANGVIGPIPATDHISQCNDGSPDIFAVRAFNTLMALDVPNPLFWQNIGSQIRFQCGSAAPTVIRENYPTYYQYRNGLLILPAFTQANSPKGHFFTNPYPFGTYPSYGLPPQFPWGAPVIPTLGPGFPTIPGGRNGVATTPGDASSSTPAYTQP